MKGEAHKKITAKVIGIYTNHSNSRFAALLKKHQREVIKGSRDADYYPAGDRMRNWHFYRENNNHLLQPTRIAGISIHPTSEKILNKRISQLEHQVQKLNTVRSDLLREMAVVNIMERAGRTLHHIQDMSTPSHVTPIYHGPDIFNQVDDAFSIKDHFEEYTCKKIKPILKSISITADEFDETLERGDRSLSDIYVQAGEESLEYIFNNPNSHLAGKVDGIPDNIPLTMFWQRHSQTPDNGKIDGFGTFGPLGDHFGNADAGIDVDGDEYTFEDAAFRNLSTHLIRKMVVDSLRGLSVLERYLHGAPLP
jgi:hypothetical protein